MRNRTKTSKFLSLILRHRPQEIGITLDQHGWAKVEELLKGAEISMEELEEIVAADEKQRYSFNEDKTRIMERLENFWHRSGSRDCKSRSGSMSICRRT